jgi:hypothetical protein
MAATSPTDAKRKYSWWWNSHICPKNSKWLQENLEGKHVNLLSYSYKLSMPQMLIWLKNCHPDSAIISKYTKNN